MKFRVKPVEVEAFQWLGNATDMNKFREFFRIGDVVNYRGYELSIDGHYMFLRNPGERLRVEPGDWIIKDADSDFQPCPLKHFEKRYEPVEETASV